MNGERMPLARALVEMGKMEKDTVLFDIQIADDVSTHSYDRDTLGSLRLPYPDMWVEWTDSLNRLDFKTPRGEVFDVSRLGMRVREVETADGYELILLPMILSAWGPGSLQVRLTIPLNQDGSMQDGKGEYGLEDIGEEMGRKPLSDEERTTIGLGCGYLLVTVTTALSLMNCRNVKTESLGRIHMRRSGAQKRRGMKPFEVRYSTIILPGGGSQRAGSGSSAHHRATSLHRVRGHFKHFGPQYGTERLFGRLEGKYWWGWQLRGEPTLGIVESSYQLDE